MKTSIAILSLLIAEMSSGQPCLSFEGTIKNEKGQTVYKFRDSQHKVEILDNRGFVQGWMEKNSGKILDKRGFPTGSIKPAIPVSSKSTKKK